MTLRRCGGRGGHRWRPAPRSRRSMPRHARQRVSAQSTPGPGCRRSSTAAPPDPVGSASPSPELLSLAHESVISRSPLTHVFPLSRLGMHVLRDGARARMWRVWVRCRGGAEGRGRQLGDWWWHGAYLSSSDGIERVHLSRAPPPRRGHCRCGPHAPSCHPQPPLPPRAGCRPSAPCFPCLGGH